MVESKGVTVRLNADVVSFSFRKRGRESELGAREQG